MRTINRKIKSNNALSEVLGTILLLGITVSVFSVVYASFFSIEVGPSSPYVNIVGTIENNNLILEHRGGKSLELDTKVIFYMQDGSTHNCIVGDADYLITIYKNDGEWGIGERFVFPLNSLSNYVPFEPIDVLVVDITSNSVILRGTLQEARIADIGINLEVDNPNPKLYEEIKLDIIARNNGPSFAKEIVIKDRIKDGLRYIEHSASNGDENYEYETGLWNIPYLDPGEEAHLSIDALVIPSPSETFTQLAVIIDGSRDNIPNYWINGRQGLSNAVRHGYIPHTGLIELTVIQYGSVAIETHVTPYDHYAQVEVGPVILTENNYLDIADEITSINQMGGRSPLSSGLNLARMELKNSVNFNPSNIQIINLIISKVPNCKLVNYNDVISMYASYQEAKDDATNIRNMLISDLGMDPEQDQINAEILQHVLTSNLDPWITNSSWLTNDIAWPGSYYLSYPDLWPPQGPGWVKKVIYAEGIVECLAHPFFTNAVNERYNTAELISTMYLDNNPTNNIATIDIELAEE